MNRTFLRDFLTGLTALAGLVGLVAMLLLFGELSSVAQQHDRFQLTISNAGGLAETSPVTLDGVKVGRVTRLESVQGVGARVHVQVKRGVRIPRTAPVSIDRGFVGDSSLQFRTVGLSKSELADVVKDGDSINAGDPGTLLGQLEGIVREPIDRLTKTADNIDSLANEYRELAQSLKDMVEPRTLADVRAGKAPNARTTLERLDNALAHADQWLGDPDLRTSAKDLVARAGRVMDEAESLAQAWTKTAQRIEDTVTKVGEDAGGVATDARALATDARATLDRVRNAVDSLSQTLEKVTNGQGAAGRFVNDPALYDNLNAAAQRLDRVLEEARQLLEKFQNEGVRLKL